MHIVALKHNFVDTKTFFRFSLPSTFDPLSLQCPPSVLNPRTCMQRDEGVASPMGRNLVQEYPRGPYLSQHIPLWSHDMNEVLWCAQAASVELKGLLKCCNVIMWTVSQIHQLEMVLQPPIQSVGCHVFSQGGGSEVI